MSFSTEPDVAVADWWLAPGVVDDPWVVCSHGPPGYAAYVRVRHRDVEADHDAWVLSLLLGDLAAHTTTPDDIVVAHWEGHFGGGAHERRDPETGVAVLVPEPYVFTDEVMAAPRAQLRDGHGSVRDYLLLRGPLAELGDWPPGPDGEVADLPELVCGAMWPTDRAWFYAWDVDDDDGATVACDEELAAALLADDRYAAWREERPAPRRR